MHLESRIIDQEKTRSETLPSGSIEPVGASSHTANAQFEFNKDNKLYKSLKMVKSSHSRLCADDQGTKQLCHSNTKIKQEINSRTTGDSDVAFDRRNKFYTSFNENYLKIRKNAKLSISSITTSSNSTAKTSQVKPFFVNFCFNSILNIL